MYAKVVPTVLSIRDTGSFTRSLLLSIYRACHSNLGKSIMQYGSVKVLSQCYTRTHAWCLNKTHTCTTQLLVCWWMRYGKLQTVGEDIVIVITWKLSFIGGPSEGETESDSCTMLYLETCEGISPHSCYTSPVELNESSKYIAYTMRYSLANKTISPQKT